MSQDQFYDGKGKKNMTTEHEDIAYSDTPSYIVWRVILCGLVLFWLGVVGGVWVLVSHNMAEVQEPCRTSAEVIENELALIILGDEYDPQLKVPPRKPEVLR